MTTKPRNTAAGGPTPAKDILTYGEPRWRELLAEECVRSPWRSLCRVRVVEDRASPTAIGIGSGTGWLASPNTVVTAAHVVAQSRRGHGPRRIELFFPATGDKVYGVESNVPDGYRYNPSKVYDALDVAVVRIEPVALPALRLAGSASSMSEVQIAGFPAWPEEWDGKFVVHSGPVISPDDKILLYGVDTEIGHSGAPVLTGESSTAAVIGLHVQDSNANPYSDQYPDHNVGLIIGGEVSDFIDEFIEAWR